MDAQAIKLNFTVDRILSSSFSRDGFIHYYYQSQGWKISSLDKYFQAIIKPKACKTFHQKRNKFIRVLEKEKVLAPTLYSTRKEAYKKVIEICEKYNLEKPEYNFIAHNVYTCKQLPALKLFKTYNTESKSYLNNPYWKFDATAQIDFAEFKKMSLDESFKLEDKLEKDLFPHQYASQKEAIFWLENWLNANKIHF